MRSFHGVRMRWMILARKVQLGRMTVAVIGATAMLAASTGTATARPVVASAARPAAVTFDATDVNALSCPSVKQCTAITPTGKQITFNPVHKGKVKTAKVFSGTLDESFAIHCATKHLCVAANSSGDVVGFNPTKPGAKPKYTATLTGASYQTSVACPSKAECVLDSYQAEGYLKPGSGKSLVSNTFSANQSGANAFATCVSTKLCVGSNGNTAILYSFNPRSPAKAKVETLTSTPAVGEISCPSSKQCTALAAFHDSLGLGMMTFNPHKLGSKPKVHGISESTMSDIACASTTYCIGGGYDYGVWIYDTKTHHHKFAAIPYDGPAAVAALTCPSKSECVVIYINGKKSVFNPAKPPKNLKLRSLSKSA